MEKTYCGACRGERGCPDCQKAARTADYTGITEFLTGITKPAVYGSDILEHCEADCLDSCYELLLAADLGTTTLAFVCAEGHGQVLASYGVQNPQRKIAADVIGRIDAAIRGQRERLTKEIREALAEGFLFVFEKGKKVLRERGKRSLPDRVRIAIAGNTTMQHILMDYPLDGMAKAPFVPYTLEGEELPFCEIFAKTEAFEKLPDIVTQAKVTIFPCFSAFVGGDLAAGAYALEKQVRGKTSVLIDLGTNGEILLFDQGKVYGTAAAMGSAFEGGRFAYASDVFRLIADALDNEVLDETGLLCEPYFTDGFCGLQQEDVREFQLAKGALRAGIEILCKHAAVPITDVQQVFAAGGFGKFCRRDDLFVTGLLPAEWKDRVQFVGNSCIGGMLTYLTHKETGLFCKGDIINLAEEPEFEGTYYRFMNFEKEE